MRKILQLIRKLTNLRQFTEVAVIRANIQIAAISRVCTLLTRKQQNTYKELLQAVPWVRTISGSNNCRYWFLESYLSCVNTSRCQGDWMICPKGTWWEVKDLEPRNVYQEHDKLITFVDMTDSLPFPLLPAVTDGGDHLRGSISQ